MEQPAIESLDVEMIKEQLENINEESSKEDLFSTINFLVRQLNLSHEQQRRNNMVILEALEKAQTRYKKYEQEKTSFKARFKLTIKKILIAWGWYEASYEELKEIHFGKTGDVIPQQSGSSVS